MSGLGEPLDTNNLVRDPELPRRDDHAETVDREALLSQIIQFATDVERMGSSLCVDGKSLVENYPCPRSSMHVTVVHIKVMS